MRNPWGLLIVSSLEAARYLPPLSNAAHQSRWGLRKMRGRALLVCCPLVWIWRILLRSTETVWKRSCSHQPRFPREEIVLAGSLARPAIVQVKCQSWLKLPNGAKCHSNHDNFDDMNRPQQKRCIKWVDTNKKVSFADIIPQELIKELRTKIADGNMSWYEVSSVSKRWSHLLINSWFDFSFRQFC